MDKKLADQLVEHAETLQEWETDQKITWCSNCGNYGIQNALTRALVLEGFAREDFVMVFDVGCNGNGADKIDAYTIHGLHGRAIPLAAGACLANSGVKVIASGGDGATMSEGVNHFVHGIRNNFPMVFICHNNENYGLTTGQASALTRCGVKMNGTPDGVAVPPINICDFALSLSPSFVARAYSGEVDHMTEIFRKALRHDGFAFVEVFQACPTYNRATPDDWYQERVKFVEDLPDYNARDLWAARKLVQDLDEDIYVGLIYENPERKSFVETLKSREGKKTVLVDEVGYVDVSGLI